MNTKLALRIVLVVLAALALTALVASAQDAPAKVMPAVYEQGESAPLAADAAESEPNDSFGTADLVEAPGAVTGKIGVAGDKDYFHFHIDLTATYSIIIDIDAASAGSALDPVLCTYDEDMVLVACNDNSDGVDSLLYVPTDDPDDDGDQDFYVTVRDYSDPDEGGNNYFYTLSAYYATFLSTTTAGNVGGVAFAPGDILARNYGLDKWLLIFDASDVGITANTSSIDLDTGGVYLALPKNMTVTGQNGSRYTITPWDVARVNVSQWGPTTVGSFANALALDGSTVGLTTASEKIDAIAEFTNSTVDLSTTGAVSVPKQGGGILAGKDEDILSLWRSSGEWELSFDGSTIPGLAGEDVLAAYEWDVNAIYGWEFVIKGTGVIDGHAVTQKDVMEYIDGDQMYWPATRFLNANLDAIDGMD